MCKKIMCDFSTTKTFQLNVCDFYIRMQSGVSSINLLCVTKIFAIQIFAPVTASHNSHKNAHAYNCSLTVSQAGTRKEKPLTKQKAFN